MTIHPATLRFYLLWAGLTGAELEEQKRLRPDFAKWLEAKIVDDDTNACGQRKEMNDDKTRKTTGRR